MDGNKPDTSHVDAVVARARAAQKVFETFDQARVDRAVQALAWALMEPERNRRLAELAVRTTGLGSVEDKIRKNHRKTLGLLRDLQGARTVGVIHEDPAKGLVEIARPLGVVGAIVPSTNPLATPTSNAINAVKCRNAVVLAPSPKGKRPAPSCWPTCTPSWTRWARPATSSSRCRAPPPRPTPNT